MNDCTGMFFCVYSEYLTRAHRTMAAVLCLRPPIQKQVFYLTRVHKRECILLFLDPFICGGHKLTNKEQWHHG